MKQRALSLLFAVGALALFYILFIGSPAGLQDDVTRPTTDTTDANGYAGARAWLAQQGIAVRSMRSRYDGLAAMSPVSTGNLLVVTLPGVERFRAEEFVPLDQWVRSGNTLLLLAALTDTPPWSAGRTSAVLAELESLSGLEFESPAARDQRLQGVRAGTDASLPTDEPMTGDLQETLAALTRRENVRIVARTRGRHPLLEQVRSLEVLSTAPARPWLLRTPYESFAFALATEERSGEGVLFIRPLGGGRIVVATVASLFANSALSRADNAKLLANVVAYSVAADGAVLFDDLRQGASMTYDAGQFWRDSRLHWTFAVLVLVWLFWVTGGTRLAVPRATPAAPGTTELMIAAGGMLAGRLRPAAGSRLVFEQFFRRLASRSSAAARPIADDPGSVWRWLATQGSVSRHDLEQLERWYRATMAGSRVPLREIHNLILRIDRQLHHE